MWYTGVLWVACMMPQLHTEPSRAFLFHNLIKMLYFALDYLETDYLKNFWTDPSHSLKILRVKCSYCHHNNVLLYITVMLQCFTAWLSLIAPLIRMAINHWKTKVCENYQSEFYTVVMSLYQTLILPFYPFSIQ